MRNTCCSNATKILMLHSVTYSDHVIREMTTGQRSFYRLFKRQETFTTRFPTVLLSPLRACIVNAACWSGSDPITSRCHVVRRTCAATESLRFKTPARVTQGKPRG